MAAVEDVKMNQLPTHAAFAKNLNQVFEIQLDNEKSLVVTLSEVSELNESARQQRFSLIFKGPEDTLLPQQLYSMRHESLGTFEIFLVPVGTAPDGFLYQAVFNQMRNPGSTNESRD
jgi:hypothetical protein